MTTEPVERAPPNPILKLAIEVGPLLAFLIANTRWGIITGTGVFMAATVVSLAASLSLFRRLPLVPLVTAVFVLFFGGLTIFLNDDFFIKIKPTVVNTLFGVLLLGGVAMNRLVMKPLLGTVLTLTDEGWRKLSVRWALFFFLLAILNEIVWRNVSTDMWVNFKVFGMMPLTILFSFSQLPLLTRYRPQEETG
ncbi:MAG: septation protein A [Proteobacteria bacterium]|nr:septation protein A [Pseudomonadota bacterium]MCH8189299.1 septation protein A [Pseudomonadota bacterium]